MTRYSAPESDRHPRDDDPKPQPSEKELALAAYWASAVLAQRFPSFRHDDFLDHARELMSDAAAAEPNA